MIGNKVLAVPGPTNIPNRVAQSMIVPLEDHRAPDLGAFTIPLLNDVKKVFKTDSGSVVVFPSSGTGGWEAALRNCLTVGDKVLTSSFGQFSMLWVKMCKDLGLETENYECVWGEATPIEKYRIAIEADKKQKIKAVLVCHNETATGVTSDVAAVRKILDDANHPALLMVDGISSIGSIEFDMDEWNVDVAVAGSQKGFMLPTGLAIVALSERVVKEVRDDRKRDPLAAGFFDFPEMLDANASGYFPYTPAMTIMRGLRTSVDMLCEEGMENVVSRHNRLARGVRAAVNAWDMNSCALDPKTSSDTVTAIRVHEGVDANEIISHAYHKYGISLGAGLNVLSGKVFRIGHLGWLNETMVMQALSGVELTMVDLGIAIEPGSGVGAAINVFTNPTAQNRLAAE